MATIQIFSEDFQDLLVSFKAEENWPLDRPEDVETLTNITREYCVSKEIASAIIQFIKKYGTDIPTQGGMEIEGPYCYQIDHIRHAREPVGVVFGRRKPDRGYNFEDRVKLAKISYPPPFLFPQY
jgi:hypothetical protein